MSRRKQGAPFSLFAFQDAITSVCGVIVLVTLMLALSLAQRVMTEAKTSAVASSKVESVREQVETLQSDLEALNAQVEATTSIDSSALGLSLGEVKAQLANARKRLEGANEESQRLEEELDKLEEQEASFADVEKRVDDLQKLAENRVQQAEEIAAQEFNLQESAVYAFSDSVREKPWYVEVTGSRFIVHGAQEKLTFDTWFSFVNWANTRPSSSEYFVLIVRPSGAKNYNFAFRELEEAGYRHGVDLIGESKPLVFLHEK
ncbi:MAG: hypothetical protein ACOX0A_07930 [Thermoguttaceae bacterium]|jgi:hypothetical protein